MAALKEISFGRFLAAHSQQWPENNPINAID